MNAHRSFSLASLCLASCLAACAGGSGSSGFDISGESRAINLALDEQRCVDFETLTICPSDTDLEVGMGAPPGTRIDILLAGAGPDALGPLFCVQLGPCDLPLTFTPQSSPSSAEYRVALRRAAAETPWQILPPPTAVGDPAIQSFTVPVAVDTAVPADTELELQIVVLVFLAEPGELPDNVDLLLDTGADFAYVSEPLSVVVIGEE